MMWNKSGCILLLLLIPAIITDLYVSVDDDGGYTIPISASGDYDKRDNDEKMPTTAPDDTDKGYGNGKMPTTAPDDTDTRDSDKKMPTTAPDNTDTHYSTWLYR